MYVDIAFSDWVGGCGTKPIEKRGAGLCGGGWGPESIERGDILFVEREGKFSASPQLCRWRVKFHAGPKPDRVTTAQARPIVNIDPP